MVNIRVLLWNKLSPLLLVLLTAFSSGAQTPVRGLYLPGKTNDVEKRRMFADASMWDVGLMFGTAHSLTDISGRPDWNFRLFLYDTQWKSLNMNLGIFTRYHYSNILVFRLQYSFSEHAAADSLGFRKSRGLAFRNKTHEGALMVEYHPFRSYYGSSVEVYGFMGLAVFYNNPRVWEHGERVTQLDDFPKVQPAIPIGAGINFQSGNNYLFGASIGWRKLFTNYLDGLKTTASSKNDSYYFISLRASYRFDLDF